MQQLPLGVQLRATAVFTSYAPGRNAAALAAVEHLVSAGAGAPLWLWGAAGSGKTHLLQSALAAWDEANGAAAYLPLALPGLQASMLAGLENFGLVALDEVDAAAGNAAMETALFHLWNGLLERGGACCWGRVSRPRVSAFACRTWLPALPVASSCNCKCPMTPSWLRCCGSWPTSADWNLARGWPLSCCVECDATRTN